MSEAPPHEASGSIPPAASVGLAAFFNHDLFIDGPARKIHIGPANRDTVLPNYNRLGATFVPGTMAAIVATGSPAAQADIQNGDVLIAIEGLAPGDYAARLAVHSVWEQPAGTSITLTLDRGEKRISRRVVLRDFLNEPNG